MAYASLLDELKNLEGQVGGILATFDINDLPRDQQRMAADIKRQITDARLDVRDYSYAQTRAEQLSAGAEARKRLKDLREIIIKSSEYDLFGAVDVAQISARIEQIISRLD